MPSVSVIMPAHNAAASIEKSINSVMKQTYFDLELLVIDDASSDNTLKIAEDLSIMDSRIKIISLSKNSGAGTARNHGIEQAQGKYIAFLDSDDLWLENKIEEQLKVFEKYDVHLVASAYQVRNQKQLKHVRPEKWINHSTMLKSNRIGCLTAIYDSEKLGKRYMPSIRKRQDYALWLSIMKDTGPAYCVQSILAEYNQTPGGLSSNKFALLKWNYIMFRETQGYSAFKSTLYTLRNAINKVFSK